MFLSGMSLAAFMSALICSLVTWQPFSQLLSSTGNCLAWAPWLLLHLFRRGVLPLPLTAGENNDEKPQIKLSVTQGSPEASDNLPRNGNYW